MRQSWSSEVSSLLADDLRPECCASVFITPVESGSRAVLAAAAAEYVTPPRAENRLPATISPTHAETREEPYVRRDQNQWHTAEGQTHPSSSGCLRKSTSKATALIT